MSSNKKLILVVGATGAQGLAVIDALLKPQADGSPSPYAVRALTRNPDDARAQDLARRGIEVVKGSVQDFASIAAALKGVYGAFVNTDTWTLSEAQEVLAGIRIFELAKEAGTVRHYVWSGLDNVFKKGNYNPKYYAEHYTAKSRVADWMKAQESVVADDKLSWSVLSTGPYMDMLNMPVFGPLKQRDDGTYVFASPIRSGHVPMIALEDLGFFARYIFDHRGELSGRELEVASDYVGWEYLVETFRKVTGKKAEWVPLGVEQWMALFEHTDVPVHAEERGKPGATTFKENFSRWWEIYANDLMRRDMEMLRRIHPGLLSVEKWMRKHEYNGEWQAGMLKGHSEGRGGFIPNFEAIGRL
ncbi:nmrA-family protein [Ganoderma leucocontextum]|nr:nmrA-family protein [Ganoderma leucocontextum]